MNGKVFVLLGKTLSGKTTISSILENEYNIVRIRSFTTRPKREGEIDGIDYHFYDDSIVLLLVATGKTIALRSYQPHISQGPFPWYYGFNKRDIDEASNPLIITDVKGLQDVKDVYGNENIVSFYLKVDQLEQSKRSDARGIEIGEEQKRRILADAKDFANVENNVDHIIDANKTPKTVAKQIAKIIENSKS